MFIKHLSFPREMIPVLLICLAGYLVLVDGVGALGFYSDDGSFLYLLPGASLAEIISSARAYVTGRNLHIIWQWIIFSLIGGSPDSLPRQHIFQSVLCVFNGLILYTLLRTLKAGLLPAFIATVLFLAYPNHPETTFWLSAGPMNVLSTLFVLLHALTSFLLVQAGSAQCPRWKVRVLTVFNFLFFIFSIFTYDQTVPVATAIAGLTILTILFNSRTLVSRWVLFGLLHCAILVFLVVWKLKDPAGGPVVSHATLPHAWHSLNQAFSISFGYLFSVITGPLIDAANDQERHIALITALLTLAGACFIFLGSEKHQQSRNLSILKSWGLIAGGGFFFLLAYLPLMIWFISPRHNYLPSVGSALVLAGIFSLVEALRRKSIIAYRIIALLMSIAATCLVYYFSLSMLVEKRSFATSYQMRKEMYHKLEARGELRGKRALILQGFPTTIGFGSGLFLSQEQVLSLNYFYRGKVQLKSLTIYAAPSRKGAFIFDEVNRWGSEAFRHVYDKDMTIVFFRKFENGHIVFDTADADFKFEKHHKVGTIDPDTFVKSGWFEASSSGPITKVARLQDDRNRCTTALRFDPAALKPILSSLGDSRLVAVLWQAGSPARPQTITSSGMEEVLIPIDLSQLKLHSDDKEIAISISSRIKLTDPAVMLKLYSVDETRPTLIQAINLPECASAVTE